MIISQPSDDRDGCRSLICDASGIIIAEMAYRCIVCSHISDSIADGQEHYRRSHMAECRSDRETGCRSPPDANARVGLTGDFEIDDDDVNFSDREDEFEFSQSSPATTTVSRNRKSATSGDSHTKGGYVTCTVCNMTKFYQSVQRRYGQFTCMGCAKFFGRFLLKPKKYSCPDLGSCPLDTAPRCKACLLLACMQTYVIDDKRKAIVDANRPVRAAAVSGPAGSSGQRQSGDAHQVQQQSLRLPSGRKVLVGQKSCKKCTGCLAEDCGTCMFCLDKTKFGGSNTLKKKCVNRRCLMSSNAMTQAEHPLQPLLIQPTA